MQQADQIAPVQQWQWLERHAPAVLDAMRAMTDAFNEMNRVFASTGFNFVSVLAEVERAQKREDRRERHARWQARNRRRR